MTLGSIRQALPAQKKCGRCQAVKSADAFARCKSRGDGLNTRCKQCCREHYLANHEAAKARMRSYHQRNREELLAKHRDYWRATNEDRLAQQRKYQAENKEAIRQQQGEYRKRNPELIAARNRDQYLKNKQARNIYAKRWNMEQRKNSPLFRIKSNLRTRTAGAIRRGGFTKLSGLNDALGCDWPTLQTHLASYFRPGMNWSNYGSVWVVDHHVPLASATDAQALLALCHYTNLRPLGKAENLRKGASMPADGGLI